VLAAEAHAGQVDKSGAPYLGHPERVAERFDPVDEPVAHAAAWLHDVLEDTDMDAEWLRLHGIPDEVIRIVELLTRTRGLAAESYYAAIRLDPVATVVKAADIADNLLPERTRLLEPATRARLRLKYDRALHALGLASDASEENA
jgi:(p)ppGpp synthase/HD superfamily hydrolase